MQTHNGDSTRQTLRLIHKGRRRGRSGKGRIEYYWRQSHVFAGLRNRKQSNGIKSAVALLFGANHSGSFETRASRRVNNRERKAEQWETLFGFFVLTI